MKLFAIIDIYSLAQNTQNHVIKLKIILKQFTGNHNNNLKNLLSVAN